MTCLYARGGVGGLEQAEQQLGVSAECTMAFDGGTTWQAWASPWFVQSRVPNNDWGAWVRARPSRRLIVDVDLIPAVETSDPNWRAKGAAGAFEGYARTLAATLVRTGLGDSYIRLGNEGNGSWEKDWIGNAPVDWSEWRSFWSRTVLAMRSVPGAHFRFIWCISEAVGAVPLKAYYPGADVVDVIGVDVYDAGFTYSGQRRWEHLIQQSGGVLDLVRFARARHKPLAVPEWGLIPSPPGGGDDPAFVRGVAALTSAPDFVLRSYFDAGSSASVLRSSPQSVAAYRRAFQGSG